MGTKSEPGRYDCLRSLGPDEPFFILKARDRFAPGLVREWARRARAVRCNPDKVKEALAIARSMARYPNRKYPT